MAEVTVGEVQQRVRDVFNKGLGAFERGNLDYAINLLMNCVEMEPRLLQARKFLRAAEIQKFKLAKGGPLTHVVTAVTALPQFVNTLLMIRSGKAQEALLSAEKMLLKDPLNPRFIVVFARAAGAADLPEAAAQTLEIARDHYPGNATLLDLLGLYYRKLGRNRESLECYEKLAEFRPNDPAASKALKDAMALNSMTKDGWVETTEKGGTFREIIKDKQEAVLLEQDAKAVKSDKDADSLIQDTLAKIEAEPRNINYYRTLARLYGQKNMFAEARSALETALKLAPGDPELDGALSGLHIKEFDFDIAQRKEAGDAEGAAAKEIEKRQYAFDDLQARVERYPNDMRLRYELGVMLLENDYVNEAIQQFQLSQRSPKHRIRSLYYQGLCFKQKKQYDMAVTQLETAMSELPVMDETKKDICYELGLLFEAAADRQKAADCYKQIYQVDIGYKDIAQKIEQFYQGGGAAAGRPA